MEPYMGFSDRRFPLRGILIPRFFSLQPNGRPYLLCENKSAFKWDKMFCEICSCQDYGQLTLIFDAVLDFGVTHRLTHWILTQRYLLTELQICSRRYFKQMHFTIVLTEPFDHVQFASAYVQ